MELCVLIPEELSLNQISSDNVSYFVCAKQKIDKDKEYSILDGDFRLGKVCLSIVSLIKYHNLTLNFIKFIKFY